MASDFDSDNILTISNIDEIDNKFNIYDAYIDTFAHSAGVIYFENINRFVIDVSLYKWNEMEEIFTSNTNAMIVFAKQSNPLISKDANAAIQQTKNI